MEPRLQRRVQRYGWDKASGFYENSWKEQLKPAQDKLLEMIELSPGEHVLETACGTGLVTERIAIAVAPGGTVTATDLSEGMLHLADSRLNGNGYSHVEFNRMDAENLDIEPEQFDVAICALGLMYVPDPVGALREMYRVLKPGGRVAIAVWGERKNCGWAEIFPIVDKRVKTDVCPMFFQQGTGNALRYSIKEAGFEPVWIERMDVNLYYENDDHAILAAFAGGPVALAYQKFDEQTKREAHSEYLNSISEFKKGDKYNILGEFVVAKGIK